MTYPQGSGSEQVINGNISRKLEMRDGSQTGGLAGTVVNQCLFRQDCQFAGVDVLFHLKVPLIGVELSKPLAKCAHFVRGEHPDFFFKLFDFAHFGPFHKARFALKRTNRL